MRKLFLILFFIVLASFHQKVVYAADTTCHPLCKTEPSCCAKIIEKLNQLGDISDLPDSEQPYHECEWDESDPNYNYRAYCRPSTCNQLPEGNKYRGHCGWYWGVHEPYTKDGYGCLIGDPPHSLCDGSSNPTATPVPGQPTQPPTGNGGAGSVTIKVHKDTASGALYDGSKDVSVYIEGPASNGHRFGETLGIPGKNKGTCTSSGGFPFTCSVGTGTWKGADNKSGTAAGSYTSTITKVPSGWQIVNATKTGTLNAGSTLTFDLVVSGGGGGNEPTETPVPGQPTNTPTPTQPPGSTGTGLNPFTQNPITQTFHDIFFPVNTTTIPDSVQSQPISTSFPQLPTVLQVPPIISSALETADSGAPKILDVFGTIFFELGQLDRLLERTVGDAIHNPLR